jgi:hypothetical protein
MVLIVIGVLLWLINSFVPMAHSIADADSKPQDNPHNAKNVLGILHFSHIPFFGQQIL